MKFKNRKKLQLHSIVVSALAIVLLLNSSVFFGACKKLVDVPKSSNLVLSKDVFATNETATSAVLGLYNKMVALNLSMSNGGLTIYSALSADELYNPAPHTNYDPFSLNNIPPNNGIIYNNFWNTGYKNIYHANAILEGLNNSTTLNNVVKNQLIGETLVIRALYFFYLTNLYGDVPLVMTTSFEKNAVMARTAKEVVTEQLITDLKTATELLPSTYASTLRARVNSFTARSLLARVYLYKRDWNNAEIESTGVISSGIYSLESELNKTFTSSSKETIWQVVRENLNTAEAAVLIPVSATVLPGLALRENLLNSFELGDQRKSSWTAVNIINNQRYYYPYKYKIRSGITVGECLIVFRLAEQYLIRAEARAEQGDLRGAILDLNILRTRSRAPVTAEISNPLPDLASEMVKSSVLDAVYKERSNELFCEWGHRWFDLKRTAMANAVLSKLKPTWKTHAQLYPIPFEETQINIFLTQNSGYAN